ncbi:nucleotidyltransferase domain-containing protein [Rhizobium leguminosarum]|uniref:anti-phage Hailong system nucleotidyltransferase HalB n=1 Tax=Rhizobium leguminosarum TaxID=384 RepID=UPI00067F6E86|nr:nucleotidyltransferase domain-containing protein [Rhizobium leguminosarum]WFT91111.1 nucleotidyltransferase domain-containing protein [Rhizobium leguminosarum]
MTIKAMLLFGSHARGDEDIYSDTDLLLISEDDRPQHVQKGHLSTSIYPLDDLLERASNGDLFVCHIAHEAKAIYDPAGQLELLREHFVLRASYEREIIHASDLGWFIIDFGHKGHLQSLVNRRIAWCVRTILIAKSAELKRPLFSAAALSEFAQSSDVLTLIKNKETDRAEPEAMAMLDRFLSAFGVARFQHGAPSYGAYVKRFSDTSNNVALSLIKAEARSQTFDY